MLVFNLQIYSFGTLDTENCPIMKNDSCLKDFMEKKVAIFQGTFLNTHHFNMNVAK